MTNDHDAKAYWLPITVVGAMLAAALALAVWWSTKDIANTFLTPQPKGPRVPANVEETVVRKTDELMAAIIQNTLAIQQLTTGTLSTTPADVVRRLEERLDVIEAKLDEQ